MTATEFLYLSVDIGFVMVMVSVALGFYRLAFGPSLTDRVVALDMMTVIIVAFCGVYAIFWLYWTKQEMVARGADIPTLWLVIIPIVNFYWLWKWAEGVEKVTRKRMSSAGTFVLSWLLGSIGYAVVQSKFNEVPARA